jgi:hypothetical protein
LNKTSGQNWWKKFKKIFWDERSINKASIIDKTVCFNERYILSLRRIDNLPASCLQSLV